MASDFYTLSYRDDTNVVISSFDSDFFQLIGERVSVLRYRGEKTVVCTPRYLTEKFGIAPEQYADFKSLVGDTADNIRGAEKVGAKTAALLLQTFGTLENTIRNAERIDKPSIKKSILENAERLSKNYELIKLKNEQPLPYDKCELMFEDIGQTTTEVLQGIGLK